MLRKILLLCLCMMMCVWVYAEQPELLKNSDVSKVMKQILDQHVDKKEMSAKIIKHSFRIYIDHFDPERMYLLEQEVQPFLDMSNEAANTALAQYQNNNFEEYKQLNNVIQKAILRAQSMRKQIEANPASLLKESQSLSSDGTEEWRDPDLKTQFAKSDKELEKRQKQALLKFIAAERTRYGDSVAKNPVRIVAIYEHNMQGMERPYLYVNANGSPLTQAESENLFVMHILKSLANSLDAHTSFLAPSEAYDMRVRLEKSIEGIGVVLQKNSNGELSIAKLVEDGPAALSGQVHANDILVSVDDKPITGLAYDKVIEMLRGANGSSLNLVLKRPSQADLIHLTLKRAAITVNEDRVEYNSEPFDNGIIGIISLHSFYQGNNGINSELDVRNAIKKLDQRGNLRGLILDLRENSGGFLTQAVKVAGLFITNGVVVISKYSNGDEKFYRDMDGKAYFKGPLIILTSKATASAAEIVAQALQDYGVALIVGDEQTYGKGTIQSQTVTENQGSSYFKVTVGKYYTVSGKTPQIQGVKADIVVPSEFSKENIGEEYLDYPLGKDVIASEYDDKLSDIDPGLKGWYLRYYMPTLQQQRYDWRKLLPELKEKSAQRVAENPGIQAFIHNKLNNPRVVEDLQLTEAVNIVKDMITLQNQQHSEPIVEETKPQ